MCRPVRGIVSLFLASLLVVAGCNTGPGIDHYVSVLETLDVPADWELVKTQRRGPGEEFDCDPLVTSTCPGADRWYALSGDVAAALEEARLMVETAGFSVDRVLDPACDGPPSGSACGLRTRREADNLTWTYIHPAGAAGSMTRQRRTSSSR